MIMQVHDELVFDIYPGEWEIVKKEAKNIMENILTWKEISLKCDAIDANSWKYTK
jgi:DNA polymerase I-like protein with 3'-5' exonuclease and polymerase domains